MATGTKQVAAIDLFCGAGGLSQGLKQAGIKIVAGIDLDLKCQYPFESNIGAGFFGQDIRSVTAAQLNRLWGPGTIRVLAGCAPCQPFSSHRRGKDTSSEKSWSLLDEFARLAKATRPHVVTMENVPRVVSAHVFQEFVDELSGEGYEVHYCSCYGPAFGLPQHRRRLVLIASRIGRIDVPKGDRSAGNYLSVRDAIYGLRPIKHGTADPHDPLHASRSLADINYRRIRASAPGGTWEDWPMELRSPCHQRPSGATFRNVYARMVWDEPAPTITTLAHNFGTGRFGHPEQDRAISLREAAILQSFPASYRFVKPGSKVEFAYLGRLIGNAVPPVLGHAVGAAIKAHVDAIA